MFQRSLVPVVVSLLAATSAYSQDGAPAPYGSMRAKEVFEQFRNVLTKAKSIKVTYDAQRLGSASETVEVLLARPNIGYLKSRETEIYFDGKQITVYSPRRHTYYKVPQNPYYVKQAFAPYEFSVWRLFFQPTAFDKVYQIRSSGFHVRKGMSMQVIEIQGDLDSLNTATLYTDPQDNQLRQAEFVRQEPKRKATTLIDVKDFKTDVDTKTDDFTFVVPEGVTYKKP